MIYLYLFNDIYLYLFNDLRGIGSDRGPRVHEPISPVELTLERVQLFNEMPLRRPDVELLREFWNYEKSSPSASLLRLENIAEDVVADVEDVLASCSYQ